MKISVAPRYLLNILEILQWLSRFYVTPNVWCFSHGIFVQIAMHAHVPKKNGSNPNANANPATRLLHVPLKSFRSLSNIIITTHPSKSPTIFSPAIHKLSRAHPTTALSSFASRGTASIPSNITAPLLAVLFLSCPFPPGTFVKPRLGLIPEAPPMAIPWLEINGGGVKGKLPVLGVLGLASPLTVSGTEG